MSIITNEIVANNVINMKVFTFVDIYVLNRSSQTHCLARDLTFP